MPTVGLVSGLVAVSALLGLLLGRVVRRRVGFVVEVESVSMTPTLGPGQRLVARVPGAVRRGDVVVVDSAELRRTVVKRVVGLPGEHVAVDARGRVVVDGHCLDEPYVAHRGGPPRVFDVPPDQLLLLGDNRSASSDARVWREPYVPVRAVRGRVVGHRPPPPRAVPGPAPRPRVPAPDRPHPHAAVPRGVG